MADSQKSLDVTSIADCRGKVPDLKVFGNGDLWQLLCKASSDTQGWMKSTKALEIPGVGVVLQVSTQQGNRLAEALVFVPRVKVGSDGEGRPCLRAS